MFKSQEVFQTRVNSGVETLVLDVEVFLCVQQQIRKLASFNDVGYRVHYKEAVVLLLFRLRPYHPENARSCLILEAKQGRAWLVLGWETTWEYQVL